MIIGRDNPGCVIYADIPGVGSATGNKGANHPSSENLLYLGSHVKGVPMKSADSTLWAANWYNLPLALDEITD
ncbi:hypothetical protein SDC9_113276 [bioreactor metagenome]|uniref:Uncharacterized protein n=1 Tax=bioreactor metagenome TaxID=1076179 RepID=A0A645BLL6_9ZZZZ